MLIYQQKPNRYVYFLKSFMLAGLVLLIDFFTKYLAFKLLGDESFSLFPGFNFTLVLNYNAVFGINHTTGASFYLAVMMVAITMGYIFWLIDISQKRKEQVGIALLFGGAMGNIINLFYSGYVIDFISIYIQNWHWPIFNMADLTIGMGVLLTLSALGNKNKQSGNKVKIG